MADFHDVVAAGNVTDDRVRALDAQLHELRQNAAGGSWSGAMVAIAVCLAGEAIAAAIREASMRADYLEHDRRLR